MTIQTDLLTAIETYFDAIHFCDTGKLASVFHPQSSLFDADNGTVFVEPIDSFSRDVGGRVSPASTGQDREAEVLMVDFLSPISATVKIRIRAHQSVFVDHLGFVRGADGWQIVSKIWHLESTVEADGQSQDAAA
ncbi:nuclear transport factor 2 family protein [Rhodobacteraceae bacterium N5(2021)]|uniref:Nuclear transport factor 2 family protein n=1 Tax=Gymnodinialimonas phycosphaerae TaxID=2841589 RepID=A0A975TR58_9RHOB|nr:nuclear transport factor 2 family protein [Gymnodinialimonas phycosphaerae]MBY4893279.1 nuclear transport factor 2 family protein [Gymnodinialimonas phycosphaerae]